MWNTPIKALFLDVGGVLLTNGWDRNARERACEAFSLDWNEVDERHHLTFDTYEEGKLTLDEYLSRVIFYKVQPFTREDFKAFMYAQSQPYQEMIDYVKSLKARFGLKTVVVSNEGRELTVYRIRKFDLDSFIDYFIASCFVHVRKPDEDIYRIALDTAQVSPEQVAYIEDRALFVEVGSVYGLRAVKHTSIEATRQALESMGLKL